MSGRRAGSRGPVDREGVSRREARKRDGARNTEAGQQGVNPGYWQAVGSTRAAAKRAKRP